MRSAMAWPLELLGWVGRICCSCSVLATAGARASYTRSRGEGEGGTRRSDRWLGEKRGMLAGRGKPCARARSHGMECRLSSCAGR